MINYKTHNILWNLNPRNLKIRSRWNYPPQHIVSKTLDPTIYCDLDLLNVGQSKIEIYYRNRDNDANALKEAITACKQQIEIAPKAMIAFRKEYGDTSLPRHRGFEQLAIIKEKQKDFEAAIDISEKAKVQGWAGDWQKRIERCKRKIR